MAEDLPRLASDGRSHRPCDHGLDSGDHQCCQYRDLIEITDLIVAAPSVPDIFKELAPRLSSLPVANA